MFQSIPFMLTQAGLAGGKYVYFPNLQLDTRLHLQNIHINTQTDVLPVQLICMGSPCIFWAITRICWLLPMLAFISLDRWLVAVRFCKPFAADEVNNSFFSYLNSVVSVVLMVNKWCYFFWCRLLQLQLFSDEIATGPSTTGKVRFWLCETVFRVGEEGHHLSTEFGQLFCNWTCNLDAYKNISLVWWAAVI